MSDHVSQKDLKLQKWASIIAEAKSSGVPLEQWTKEHDIPMSTYWYWHKKVTSESPAESVGSQSVFAELTPPSVSSSPAIVTLRKGELSAEVSEDISTEFLTKIVKVMAHV